MSPAVGLALLALAQPAISNGSRTELPAPADLAAALDALPEGSWLGYSVPRVAGGHHPCGTRTVSLEGGTWDGRRVQDPDGDLALFARVEAGRVTKLRVLGTDCTVDAGGATVRWWSGVDERASLSFLDGLARSPDGEVAEEAATALALHAHPDATGLLESLATSRAREDVREKAVFWLGAARGSAGFEALSRLASAIDSSDVREKVAFALHVSDAEGATERLVEMARRDASRDVREKAIFWLSQEAGEIASRAIVSTIADDPDLKLKEKAVFALSQLPPDEGVPLLVDVAESHPHPSVRKKALFWLGQSDDPRAIALFERILLGR